MPIPAGESCSNCQYWDDGTAETRDCLWRPPDQLIRQDRNYWRRTGANKWCGQWKAINGGGSPSEPGSMPGLGAARMTDNRTSLGTRGSWQRLSPAGISPGILANWSYNTSGQLVLDYADADPTDNFLVTIQAAATIEGAKKVDQTLGLAIGQNNAVQANTSINVNVGEDNHRMELVVFGSGLVTNGTTFELFSQNPGDAAWVWDWHMVCKSDGPIPAS